EFDAARVSPLAASIVTRLGGHDFFARIGAEHLVYRDAAVSFCLPRRRSTHVRLVTIARHPLSFRISCFGWIRPGTLGASMTGTATVDFCQNLVAALAELTGIDVLRSQPAVDYPGVVDLAGRWSREPSNATI